MTEIARDADAFVLFTLAESTYALPTDVIQQLDMVGSVTPVPNAAPHLAGIVSVRGQVLPAIDLRARFGFPGADPTVRSRLLVVRVGGRTVGFIVDSAREFARIPREAVHAPPEALTGSASRFLRGVAQLGDRIVLVLDAARLLSESDDSIPAGSDAAGA